MSELVSGLGLFLGGIAVLIAGYFFHGRLLERALAPDDRPPPCDSHRDGVDYVPLPLWKNMLIQLLNIAGVGPVIGVILGIRFGWIVFLIIPIGNVIGGAVHDYAAGFYSIRRCGANLPVLTREMFGRHFSALFSAFMIFLLLLVVAVFINIPASIINEMVPSHSLFYWAVGAIFLYYILATLFPIDRIIGRVYPFFGGLLLLGTFAVFSVLVVKTLGNPSLLTETEAFKTGKILDEPIIPCLFVTIACGIISGFHATQSPIIARTLTSERQAKAAYYGMMIAEGIVAMVWAAAGMAIYNLHPELMQQKPMIALLEIATSFLGSHVGAVVLFGVVVLAITSGDTALRSLRLSLAELFHIPQKKLLSRVLLCLPAIVCVAGLLVWSNRDARSFANLWNYFAWGNQVLATSTLMACTVWMMRRGKSALYTLLPGMFMAFVVISYILWTSSEGGRPYGFGLPLCWCYAIAGCITLILAGIVIFQGKKGKKEE